MKKTKIVCTLGPSCESPAVLKKMIAKGMNAARINTAHGTEQQYATFIKKVRDLADIPIILDIKGPELRIRVKENIEVKKNSKVEVGFSKKYDIHFSYNCIKDLKKGDEVLIEDGLLKATITQKKAESVVLTFTANNTLKNNKNVAIPNRRLNLPPLSKKDKQMIEFAKKKKIEFIALSFTRNAQDVKRVRKLLGTAGTGIIAKIENREGLDNIKHIVAESQGIMVARGDMGVELPLQEVPLAQKKIIRICNNMGVLVITATQMLDSMINNHRPTRAEASDVANAILDGTDAVMLSGETAAGKYPVESVATMTNIAHEVEGKVKSRVHHQHYENVSDAMTKSIHELCKTIYVDTIVSLTHSGYTARMMSRFREHKHIIALTPNPIVKRQLELYFGVLPFHWNIPKQDRILHAAQFLVENKVLRKKDVVVFTAGLYTTIPHASNLVEVHHLAELMKYVTRLRN